MLDQFRTLSQEANVLENSNHTLETEANQTKVQLSLALDHAADLEKKMQNQETIIRSYERQIAELTSQIASLELQMKQQSKVQEKLESELTTTRDLYIKLDKQKDNLLRQLSEKESQRAQVISSFFYLFKIIKSICCTYIFRLTWMFRD